MGMLHLTPKEALDLFRGYCRNPRDFDSRKLAEHEIHIIGKMRLEPDIYFLPPHVIFEKELDARVCQLARFNYEVWGTANFSGSNVEHFGPECKFESDLLCSDTAKLKTFSATVGGNANFRHSAVTEFSSSANFMGELIACDTHHLKVFNAKVRGSADLSGSSVKKLGANVSFGAELDLSHTPFLETFNHEVGWDAYFFQSAVRTFGPKTKIGGNLFAYGTWNLKRFDGSVAGVADFTGSNISEIGSEAYFGGELDLTDAPNIETKKPEIDAVEATGPKRGWTQSLQEIIEWMAGGHSPAREGGPEPTPQMRQQFAVAVRKAQHLNPVTGRKR